MNHQQEMLRHLHLAQRLDDEVNAIEAEALGKLGLSGVRDRVAAYQMKAELEHNELYKQRGGARNVHVNLAIMHGIAALVQEADET